MSHDSHHCYHCCRPGMVNGDISTQLIPDGLGGTCWKATQPIGHLFGQPVHGDLEAYGTSREQALERLATERNRLYESLWA